MTEIAVLDDQAASLAGMLADSGVRAASHTDPGSLLATAPATEILLAAPAMAAAVASRLPRLRWIQSTWAGVDALLGAGVPDGVILTGLRGVFGTQMREFVFGHLLAHTQRVAERTRARRWDPTPPPLLAGSRLGVLGTGSIGAAIAAIATHLDMPVRGCNLSGRQVGGFEQVFPVSQVPAFADGLDHLVVALPATPATEHLVDAELLERLAPGATLVNVGRGSTVDVDAVVGALAMRRLSLAVLDVLPVEPLPEGDPLWDVEGLVITSHTAAWSRPDAVAAVFLDNLRRYEDGAPLAHVVDLGRGY